LKLKVITYLIFSIVAISSYAQNVKLQIVIKNEKNELVQNATAQLLKATDSSIIAVKTLKNGVFFSVKENSNCFLRLSAVGINIIYTKIDVANKDTIFAVTATTKTNSLDAAVVTSVKKLITQDDDKTVVDAELLASTSTNALEVLEKTPGAIIDQDGNVYLNSATPATIYINGREQKLSATEVASILKTIPASSISKIEILRNPSAKYDAASSGGIVNIVLKKGVKLGVNGSTDASYFQGVYGTQSIGFNVTKNDNKLNTYFSYNFTHRTNFLVLESRRPYDSIVFIQSSFTKFPAVTNNIGAGFDYQANKKWSIAFDAKVTFNNNPSFVKNDIDILQTSTLSKGGQNVSLVSNTGPTYILGNSVSSKYKINEQGSEWTNTLDFTYFKNDNKQDYDNISIRPARNTLFGDGTIENIKNNIAFKSDVVIKTKDKVTYEFGTKLNFSKSNIDALYFADTTGTTAGKYVNSYQTNAYKYTENIAAVYFQVSKTIKGITIKPGLRFEYTDITGKQIVPNNNTFNINRTNLFPYLFLKTTLGKALGFKLTGNLIFRRSITRPGYDALNPFPKFADQYTYDVGDPNLTPQLTNNYEFNVSANEFPIFSVGVNDIQNIFTTLTKTNGDTLFRTYDNIGRNKEIYMRLVGGIPPGKRYFFYAGTIMNIVNFDGLYSNVPFQYKRTSWNIFMLHNYKVNPTLNITLNGFMRLNGVTNFFEFEPIGALNLSASKTLLKKKMTITLTANDMLLTNRVRFNVDVPKFIGTGNSYNDTRKIGIAIRYNFGFKPRPERRQGFDIPPEAN
jgi:iron complex outermembrane recepter protein